MNVSYRFTHSLDSGTCKEKCTYVLVRLLQQHINTFNDLTFVDSCVSISSMKNTLYVLDIHLYYKFKD